MSEFNKPFDNQKENSVDENGNFYGYQEERLNPEQLGQEMAELRRMDRKKMYVFGTVAALMLAVGTVMYIAKDADSAPKSEAYGYTGQSGSYGSSGVNGAYADYSTQYGAAAGGGAGAGGCCGGGAGAGGGGCGSGGGSAVASVSLPDLEKQGLAKYKEETGKTDVTAKATDRGCHTQVDISDASGKIVRSYGFQGGPLYVIQ